MSFIRSENRTTISKDPQSYRLILKMNSVFPYLAMLVLCLSISKVFMKTDEQGVQIQEQVFRDSPLIWFLLASPEPKRQLCTLAVSLLPSCGKNRWQQGSKKNAPWAASKLNTENVDKERIQSLHCSQTAVRKTKIKYECNIVLLIGPKWGPWRETTQLQNTLIKS